MMPGIPQRGESGTGAAQSSWFALDTGGRWVGFPESEVRQLFKWQAPIPLPRGAAWLMGWFPFEGVAVPVVDPHVTGANPSAGTPNIMAMLQRGENSFVLPGFGARFSGGEPRELKDPGQVLYDGVLEIPGLPEVMLTTSERLYTILIMGYNRVGSDNRG